VAKARPIPGVGEDDPFALAAAEVVAIRSAELAEQSADVLDIDDIERVHDMRVATRRLRAALEVFEPCFPKKRFNETLREVKALADALGERRDRDVTIAALSVYETALGPPGRPGVRSLAERLRAEQIEANVALGPYVTEERIAALAERLGELVAAARAQAVEAEVAGAGADGAAPGDEAGEAEPAASQADANGGPSP
jgi:CHAD domain-containing protein